MLSFGTALAVSLPEFLEGCRNVLERKGKRG